eukprot:scaffold128_cov174-Skeletonema_marinoi.AAC.1
MANYHGSLEAVDCHIHSVRYDMAVNRGADGHLRCFIRLSGNHNERLEAVDCDIHSDVGLKLHIPNWTSSGHLLIGTWDSFFIVTCHHLPGSTNAF